MMQGLVNSKAISDSFSAAQAFVLSELVEGVIYNFESCIAAQLIEYFVA